MGKENKTLHVDIAIPNISFDREVIITMPPEWQRALENLCIEYQNKIWPTENETLRPL